MQYHQVQTWKFCHPPHTPAVSTHRGFDTARTSTHPKPVVNLVHVVGSIIVPAVLVAAATPLSKNAPKDRNLHPVHKHTCRKSTNSALKANRKVAKKSAQNVARSAQQDPSIFPLWQGLQPPSKRGECSLNSVHLQFVASEKQLKIADSRDEAQGKLQPVHVASHGAGSTAQRGSQACGDNGSKRPDCLENVAQPG